MFSIKHITQSACTLTPFPTLSVWLLCSLTAFWERENLLVYILIFLYCASQIGITFGLFCHCVIIQMIKLIT